VAKLLKNLYNAQYINLLANELQLSYEAFNKESFINSVFDKIWQQRELKQRMRHISTLLDIYLLKDYTQNIEILKATFSRMDYSFALENMIFQDYVEVYGINYFEVSMDALEYFTINSSSEFAIRAFILRHEIKTMQQMQTWAISPNHHIRRLASEGCRPRLPWAIGLKQFQENPSKILKILDILKDDTNIYVRKSVANNLNDISKDNPEAIKILAKKWIGKNQHRDWILKHGLRTLLKKGDREVLNLFDFHQPKHIQLTSFYLLESIKVGENLKFSFILNSTNNLGKLRIEFAIEFLRQNNKYNKKVFQIAEGYYKENSKEFFKTYSFKPISTRVYYKGEQILHIIVNGETLISKRFHLG